MTLAPVWRTRLFAVGAILVAVWMGTAIATQELAWPSLLFATLLGLIVVRVQTLPLTAVLLGASVCGYIVGNRGFAQISPSTIVPLLPAELVLAIGCSMLGIQCALRRELPWRADLLNYAVLVWLIAGAGRLIFDVRPYGFAAVRDFATVYYAVFFLLAQKNCEQLEPVRFLHGCLLASCALLPATLALFEQFPHFFLGTLTLRGVPLIYYKGDLAGTFMAAGAVMSFVAFERERRGRWLALSFLLTAGMLSTQNRASMLGLVVVALLLALGGRFRFAIFQAGAGVLTAAVLFFAAHLSNKPWQQTAIHSVYERAVSLVDPFGNRTYSGEITFNKGDNNRFRTVWWRAVWDETWNANPWFGLGFGYDLAQRFVREYYPDAADEFSTRSPHNIFITLFGRTGILGLTPFLLAAWVTAVQTVRAIRRGPSLETALWCATWVILTSACFGVVLEGPMGAVVFWTALGVANAARWAARSEGETAVPTAVAETTSLPTPALAR